MGNLRQKYTEEEWDNLGKNINLKPSINVNKDFQLIREIEKLVKQTPNDQELGSKIRELIKFGKIKGEY